ncbi:MAG: ATP-binding protein [Myxococcales bacterium]
MRDEQTGAFRDVLLLYQNAAAARVTQLPAGAFAEPHSIRTAFPQVAETILWQGHDQVATSGQPWQGNVHYVGAGVNGWFRVTISRVRDDHVAVTFEDITDIKRIEEDKLESAQISEVLLKVSHAISDLSLEKIVQRVTDEARLVCRAEFGAFFYNVRDASGESYTLYTLSGVPREAFARFPMPRNTALFGPTFRGERVVRIADVRADPRYGKSAPHYGMPKGHLPVRSYLAVPVISRTGEVLGGLFFGHSAASVFTERDERIVTAIAQQAAVAMDNARLLEIAQRESATAEAASRAKDEFLATISHELRTPLNAILGWANMLQTGHLAPEKQQRALEAIERNARSQAALIADMLDVSRIVSGRLSLNMFPFSVSKMIYAALDAVRPMAESKQVQLKIELEGDLGLIKGDPTRLQQVVWNLINNAVKFTPSGGHVAVHATRAQASLQIRVEDDGRGIEPAFLPHVFERFRQADASSTRSFGGLGLGLSIVKHIVELHGGTVSAHSAGAQQGSTFTVTLPFTPLPAGERVPISAIEPISEPLGRPARLSGLKVLVVDDEADARDLLRAVLEHSDAQVLTAENTSQAMAILEGERPDVLVSDIGMPGEDGYSLIGRVRALKPSQGGRIPAVALTAYASPQDRTRALARGFNHHVTKPVDASELLVVIASLVERYATG